MKFWFIWNQLKPFNTRVVRRLKHSSINTGYDVILVGGGVMGLSSAYFLAKRIDPSSICIIERDSKYTLNSTVRSWGSFRQQFSISENIQMSQFSIDFMENLNDHLGIDGDDPVNLQLKHGTYCYLASERGERILKENAVIQRALGVPISLLDKDQLALKYPWLNTENVTMASDVSYGEGWFDPWLLLSYLKRKVFDMGVQIIDGEVKSIDTDEHGQISGVKFVRENATELENLRCGNLVNAAGAWSDTVSRMIGIDLPVCAAKRVTFVVHCPDGPTDPVLLIDTIQNFFIRPEGGEQYIVMGQTQEVGNDVNLEDCNIDYDNFDNEVWPKLAYRIPAFERLKVTSAWAGFYEYNTMDQNGIISRHPEIQNFFFANGFSGHGIQQSPAVGRAISELIVDGSFQTIDLFRYSYERFRDKKLIIEKNVI